MINEWLKEFKAGWTAKDIDRVIDLFTDDVEYWETPFKKLENKNDVRDEWQAIIMQSEIDINLSVYSSESSRYAVVWSLSYIDSKSVTQNWAGVYLIELNENAKCVYFYQVGERRR